MWDMLSVHVKLQWQIQDLEEGWPNDPCMYARENLRCHAHFCEVNHTDHCLP